MENNEQLNERWQVENKYDKKRSKSAFVNTNNKNTLKNFLNFEEQKNDIDFNDFVNKNEKENILNEKETNFYEEFFDNNALKNNAKVIISKNNNFKIENDQNKFFENNKFRKKAKILKRSERNTKITFSPIIGNQNLDKYFIFHKDFELLNKKLIYLIEAMIKTHPELDFRIIFKEYEIITTKILNGIILEEEIKYFIEYCDDFLVHKKDIPIKSKKEFENLKNTTPYFNFNEISSFNENFSEYIFSSNCLYSNSYENCNFKSAQMNRFDKNINKKFASEKLAVHNSNLVLEDDLTKIRESFSAIVAIFSKDFIQPATFLTENSDIYNSINYIEPEESEPGNQNLEIGIFNRKLFKTASCDGTYQVKIKMMANPSFLIKFIDWSKYEILQSNLIDFSYFNGSIMKSIGHVWLIIHRKEGKIVFEIVGEDKKYFSDLTINDITFRFKRGFGFFYFLFNETFTLYKCNFYSPNTAFDAADKICKNEIL